MNRRVLVLGPDQGWHADSLRAAACQRGDQVTWARYESLAARIDSDGRQRVCAGAAEEDRVLWLDDFDHVLARTMPVGSLEQITLRLSILHYWVEHGGSVVNSPTTMEWAIDKYRTLSKVAALGYPVPATRIVQSRREAMAAFDELGGDVVAKPLFGGEGRGVMRVADRELAWFTFATLERIDAVIYLQEFVRPGGRDTRILIVGEEIYGLRRTARDGWKTNVSQGGYCEPIQLSLAQQELGRHIAEHFHLQIGSVDLIDAEDGIPKVLEVNAIPGWKGAQQALGIDIADRMLAALTAKNPHQLPQT